MTKIGKEYLDDAKVDELLCFFSIVGRNREDSEAWVHALIDIKESCDRIFEEFLPEALSNLQPQRDLQEIFGDIREEFRHIEYHVNDVIGK